MTSSAKCPHCGVEMEVPPSLQNQEVECPSCAKPFLAMIEKPAGDEPVVRRRSRRRDDDDDYDDDIDDFDLPSPERRRQLAEARLRPAALWLIIAASIRLLVATLCTTAMGIGLGMQAAKLGFGVLVFAAFLAVEFCRTFACLYGAWQMLHARSYGWGLAAGILMLIPAFDYPCCFISWFVYLGIGVWSILIVNEADVRWLIREKQKAES